jgi:hypothetical protein
LVLVDTVLPQEVVVIEQMVLDHNQAVINLQFVEPMVEIHHLREEPHSVGDMEQVLIGAIHQTMDMADPVVVEVEHLDTAMVPVTVVLLAQVDVEALQLNLHPHMVVMETEEVVELDSILQAVEAVLVVEVEKELLEVLLLVATV